MIESHTPYEYTEQTDNYYYSRLTYDKETPTVSAGLYLKINVWRLGFNVLGMESSSDLMHVTFRWWLSHVHKSGHISYAEAILMEQHHNQSKDTRMSVTVARLSPLRVREVVAAICQLKERSDQ